MSTTEEVKALPNELFRFLDGERLVLISTIDAETHTPTLSALSWVKAYDSHTIRFALSSNSRTIQNIKSNPEIVLGVIGLDTVYSIKGSCEVLDQVMPGVAIKLTKLQLKVDNVFDSMFWGAKIVQEPLYEKTYDLEKAKKLDQQVYASLMQS